MIEQTKRPIKAGAAIKGLCRDEEGNVWVPLWLQVCQYGNGTCGAFEALTQRGYLITDVANIGYVSASYTITVSNQSHE